MFITGALKKAVPQTPERGLIKVWEINYTFLYFIKLS
jgi:hypothetical protein